MTSTTRDIYDPTTDTGDAAERGVPPPPPPHTDEYQPAPDDAEDGGDTTTDDDADADEEMTIVGSRMHCFNLVQINRAIAIAQQTPGVYTICIDIDWENSRCATHAETFFPLLHRWFTGIKFADVLPHKQFARFSEAADASKPSKVRMLDITCDEFVDYITTLFVYAVKHGIEMLRIHTIDVDGKDAHGNHRPLVCAGLGHAILLDNLSHTRLRALIIGNELDYARHKRLCTYLLSPACILEHLTLYVYDVVVASDIIGSVWVCQSLVQLTLECAVKERSASSAVAHGYNAYEHTNYIDRVYAIGPSLCTLTLRDYTTRATLPWFGAMCKGQTSCNIPRFGASEPCTRVHTRLSHKVVENWSRLYRERIGWARLCILVLAARVRSPERWMCTSAMALLPTITSMARTDDHIAFGACGLIPTGAADYIQPIKWILSTYDRQEYLFMVIGKLSRVHETRYFQTVTRECKQPTARRGVKRPVLESGCGVDCKSS